MNTNQRVLEKLRQAVAILEAETPEPVGDNENIPSYTLLEGEVELFGTIGNPRTRPVGEKQSLLFTAGLKTVRDSDGRTEWVNLEAWRNTAAWAEHNLTSGTRIKAVGRWDSQEWTTQDGELKNKTFFSVRCFSPI